MLKEIWMAESNPVIGNEPSGIRLIVVISGETMIEFTVLLLCFRDK